MAAEAPKADEEGTYAERVLRVAEMMDPRTALCSDAEVDAAVALVRDHEAGLRVAAPEELYRARKLRNAVVHPDTGDKVFLPLRLSFIVPCNLVLDTLMMSARGTPQVIAAQWLNQTYNALHYRANANGTAAQASSAELAQAYVGATASSVAAALAVERWAERASARGVSWAPLARRFGPFAAVAAADVLNLGLMRRSEWTAGIVVRDAQGAPLGQSPAAGALAVGACIFGRIGAAAPILTLPPLLLHRLERRFPGLRARPVLGTGLLMGAVAALIQASVPLTFGVFKQTASVPSQWLEPEIAARAPGQRVWYNKGI